MAKPNWIQQQMWNVQDAARRIVRPVTDRVGAAVQLAAVAVETVARRQEEIRNIPQRVSSADKALSAALNLPPLSPGQEEVIRKVTPYTPVGFFTPPHAHDFTAGVVTGGYEGFRTKPLTAVGSVAVGAAGGAALKGATLLPRIGPVVASRAPTIAKGLEAAYAGSVGVRTGMAGPDLYQMGKEFGGILTTEAIPMYAGATAVPRLATTLPKSFKPAKPLETPPSRQTTFDVTGEIGPPRPIATTGRTRVYGAEQDFPPIRGVAKVGRTRVYGTEPDFPPIREVARVSRTQIYGTEPDIPPIREVARVGRTRVYGTEPDFPPIRELGRDPAGIKVFDATGKFGTPQLLGTVDVKPPKFRQPSPGREVQTFYTPEALGAKQRTIMAQRRQARVGAGGPQVIQEAPKISSRPPGTLAKQVPGTTLLHTPDKVLKSTSEQAKVETGPGWSTVIQEVPKMSTRPPEAMVKQVPSTNVQHIPDKVLKITPEQDQIPRKDRGIVDVPIQTTVLDQYNLQAPKQIQGTLPKQDTIPALRPRIPTQPARSGIPAPGVGGKGIPGWPKEEKRKKKKKRSKEPYDWIVENPVHDIESVFGIGPPKRKKR